MTALSLRRIAMPQDSAKNLAQNVVTFVDDDAALVARAKTGDSAAFSALFVKHHGRVYAFCARMLRTHPGDVEDAVQHVFFEAWKSLHRFEGRSRFSTWITRIAIHTCLGFRRKLKRWLLSRRDDGQDDVVQTQFGSQPSMPDDEVAGIARATATDAILAQLTTKKRVVFVLSEFQGHTAPEIAQILNIPDATVRTRLFHARRDFTQLAQKHPGFADLFEGDSGSGRPPVPTTPPTTPHEPAIAAQHGTNP